MAKAGRPTLYHDWMPQCLIDIASVPGNYKSAILVELGRRAGIGKPISVDTFQNWVEQHEEFADAWDLAQIITQSQDERMLVGLATGELKGNAKALELLMKTKYRKEYITESKEPQVVNNNLTIQNLSMEEIKYRLQRSTESLKKAGITIDLPAPEGDIIDVNE